MREKRDKSEYAAAVQIVRFCGFTFKREINTNHKMAVIDWRLVLELH